MKRYHGDDYTFIINRVKLEDRGEYIIRAENHYGYREEVVFLNVQRKSFYYQNFIYIYILHLFHFYIFHFFQHCREKFRSTGPSCILYADENRLAIMCGWRRSSRRRASRSCCDHVSYRSGRLANCFAVWAAIHRPPWNGTRTEKNYPSTITPWATPTASSQWRSLTASRRTAANIVVWQLTNMAKTRLVA